jgi:hypothetical protein
VIYEYLCSKCGNTQDEECSVNSFKEFRPLCSKCGAECAYQFCPTNFHFVLKDGPSGSYPSKGIRVKQQRAKASMDAARRQRERYGNNCESIPNYKGKETGTWREAQNQALVDRGAESAATYDSKVRAEGS